MMLHELPIGLVGQKVRVRDGDSIVEGTLTEVRAYVYETRMVNTYSSRAVKEFSPPNFAIVVSTNHSSTEFSEIPASSLVTVEPF